MTVTGQIRQEPTYKVEPGFKPHEQLENDVNEHLNNLGFITHSSAYHNVMNGNEQERQLMRLLTNRWSATSLYIRARADRIAVHKTLPIEFEFDLKTKERPNYHDLMLEIWPVILHKSKYLMGIDCLYCCRVNGNDGGFWINEMPDPNQFNLPPKRKNDQINPILKKWILHFWPDAWIDEIFIPGGSGDPYLKILANDYRALPDWKELIEQRINGGG